MTLSPRLVAVALLLLGACSGIPLPGQSLEQFFARCMARFGYEVFDGATERREGSSSRAKTGSHRGSCV